ncbi:MAG TPA: metallophosphoesterase [Woeseiaceae bacterium]|nr:metallophosphoesterase [Woeseiaceae bacterium]
MKLHVLSDLHTEFADFSPADTGADVVILAGDIGVGLGGIEWASRRFPKLPVIYVPGNHEYYGHDIGFTAELKAAAPANIHVLHNDTLELDGVRFLGSTLWTDFKLYGDGEAWFARQRAKQWMQDFALIRNDERRFTPEDSVLLHEASKAWLEGELEKWFDGPTVVVTHHLPAATSVAKRYVNDPLSPAFASRLDDHIETHRPELWIHGHTHVPCDYRLFDTRIVCNPRGYPGENGRPEFRDDLVVSVCQSQLTPA